VESSETDFFKAYPGLSAHRNIRLLGSMVPSSSRFAEVLDRCDAFLFPSCSEGTSSSALTCCRAGIYPILSRNSGVDLPEGTGTWIESLTVRGVEDAILSFLEKDWSDVVREADAIRAQTESLHSRESFTKEMTAILAELDRTPPTTRDPADTHAWRKGLDADIDGNPIFS